MHISVFKILYRGNNILCVIVASNCTDLLQPLDLSINKFCEIKVPGMYGGIICKQLEEEIEEEVDMRLFL